MHRTGLKSEKKAVLRNRTKLSFLFLLLIKPIVLRNNYGITTLVCYVKFTMIRSDCLLKTVPVA